MMIVSQEISIKCDDTFQWFILIHDYVERGDNQIQVRITFCSFYLLEVLNLTAKLSNHCLTAE